MPNTTSKKKKTPQDEVEDPNASVSSIMLYLSSPQAALTAATAEAISEACITVKIKGSEFERRWNLFNDNFNLYVCRDGFVFYHKKKSTKVFIQRPNIRGFGHSVIYDDEYDPNVLVYLGKRSKHGEGTITLFHADSKHLKNFIEDRLYSKKRRESVIGDEQENHQDEDQDEDFNYLEPIGSVSEHEKIGTRSDSAISAACSAGFRPQRPKNSSGLNAIKEKLNLQPVLLLSPSSPLPPMPPMPPMPPVPPSSPMPLSRKNTIERKLSSNLQVKPKSSGANKEETKVEKKKEKNSSNPMKAFFSKTIHKLEKPTSPTKKNSAQILPQSYSDYDTLYEDVQDDENLHVDGARAQSLHLYDDLEDEFPNYQNDGGNQPRWFQANFDSTEYELDSEIPLQQIDNVHIEVTDTHDIYAVPEK